MMIFVALMLFAFLAGVLSAIPTGPVGVLIISNTLNRSMRSGLKLLLGLIVVELGYLVLFYYGLDRILTSNQLLMNLFVLLGSLFLIFLGTSEFKKKVQRPQLANHEFSTALMMSITNPGIFFIFAAVIASAKNIFPSHFVTDHILLLLALFEVGTVVWFLVVIFALGKVRSRIGVKFLSKIKRVGGVVLIGLGLYNIVALLLHP